MLATKRLFKGNILSLRVDTVLVESKGVQATREVVEHGNSVTVVPVDADDNVVLVRQYRLPTQGDLLESPAGGVEPGESPEAAVHRELLEETGYRAQRVAHLGGFWIAPGWATEYMDCYLATGLVRGTDRQEADEDIQVVRVPFRQVSALIREGKVRDAKSIAALLMALHLYPEHLARL